MSLAVEVDDTVICSACDKHVRSKKEDSLFNKILDRKSWVVPDGWLVVTNNKGDMNLFCSGHCLWVMLGKAK